MKLVHRLLPPLFLLAVLAFFIANCWLLDRATVAFTRSASPRDTLVGLPEPRFFTDPDAYAWLSHTRDMLLAGDWRIRHTHMDNAPYGRPMHWSHLLIWELAAHARLLQHLHPGMLLSPALEIAGRCAMPFFSTLFLSVLFFLLHRKLGFLPAAVYLSISAALPCLTASASPLVPDHHLLQQNLVILPLLCLSFANWGHVSEAPSSSLPTSPSSLWFRLPPIPSPASARRWFIAAGICHAALLWIGATIWLSAHLVLCLAALATLGPSATGSRPAPRLWFCFLASSLPLSIAFYLLEYAPHFPGMRLEVNHPLYWLFLTGSVLALSRISSLRTLSSPATLRSLAVPFLLALSLPLAILFGPSSWHAFRDPALRLLHERYIEEFRPAIVLFHDHPLNFLSTFRFLLLPLLLTPWFLFRRDAAPGPAATSLRPLSLAAILYALLFCLQIRWGRIAASLLPLLAVFAIARFLAPPSPLSPSWPRRLAAAFLLALFADAAVCASQSALFLRRWADPDHCPADWLRADTVKRSALRLAVALQDRKSPAIAGLPAHATAFYWFASVPSLASFYWENVDGWHDETALFADDSPHADAARAIAARRSLPAVCLPDSPNEIPRFYADLHARRLPSSRDFLTRLVASSRISAPLPPGVALAPAIAAAISATNYYHPAPDTRLRDAIPALAFDFVP